MGRSHQNFGYSALKWIVENAAEPKKRGGFKPKKLNVDHISEIVAMVEEDNQLTLDQIRSKLAGMAIPVVSPATISRSLNGMAFTMKKCHQEPASMNTLANKLKRKQYAEKLLRFQVGKFYLQLCK